MALTDQPYLPLYVKDWLSNKKLKFCNLGSHGLLINIMCIMHKEDNYGTIELNDKFKKNESEIHNFSKQLAKLTPFTSEEIINPLIELIQEKVLKLEGNVLICKRMLNDGELSKERAKSGEKGGKAKHVTKGKTNVVNVNANEIVSDIEIRENKFCDQVLDFIEHYPEEILNAFIDHWTEPNKSKTKMLFETKTTWDLSRRLGTWKRNDDKWNHGKNKQDSKKEQTGSEDVNEMWK